MSWTIRITGLVFVLISPAPVSAACPSNDLSVSKLERLRADAFVVADVGERDALAIRLLDCLGNADPEIRDATAFTGLSKWLRGGELSVDTIRDMYVRLGRQVIAKPDEEGFRQPFAILVLSEVARVDRLDPVLTDSQREALVDLAVNCLSQVRDYRGFRDGEGWRHGVAHGADLVLQLAVNPRIDAQSIERLMSAVLTQIAPTGVVHYVHGESERLARAVFFTYQRDLIDTRFWNGWFSRLVGPSPFVSWAQTFDSEAGLARRNNVLSFLLNLKFAASTAENAPARTLEARTDAAIIRVMGG